MANFEAEFCIFESSQFVSYTNMSLGFFSGIQPVGESWSENCLLTLHQCVTNRILRIEIQTMHESKALVTMIDEASDPMSNVAEMLISVGYAAPTPVTTSVYQQAEETTAAAELCSGNCMKLSSLGVHVKYWIDR